MRTTGTARANDRRLPLGVELLYACGEIPITVTMALVGLFALFFYHEVMGLDPALAGIGVSSGLLLDALIDPWIGHWSDRTRGGFGRRHGFLLGGALALGPCFLALFAPPRALPPVGIFVWLMASSLLFRMASAVYRIPYLSLGAELTEGYDERTRLIAVRSVFGLAGMLLAVLSFTVFFAGTGAGDPKLDYRNYPKLAAAFGTLMSVSALAASMGTWSRRNRIAAGPVSARGEFFRGLGTALRNAGFRNFILSFTLFYLAVVLNATLAVDYFKWYAGISGGRTLSLVQGSFYAGAFAGVLLCLALARRAEKRTLYLISASGTAAMLGTATLLIGPGRIFGTGQAWPLVAGFGLCGLFASGLWVMPYSMLADVADQDTLATGLRRGGVYFGILNFGEKVAAGGALLVSGLLLRGYVRLEPKALVQAPQAIARLGMAFGLAPGILVLAAAALIIPYGLHRRAVAGIQRELGLGEIEGHG